MVRELVMLRLGILSGNAVKKLNDAENIKKVVICNTIPLNSENLGNKFVVLSVGTLIAETIRRIYNNESLSEIFL